MEDNYNYVKKTSSFDLRWRKNETIVSKYLDLLNLYKKGFKTYVVILDVENSGLVFVPIEETKKLQFGNTEMQHMREYCTKLKTDYNKYFLTFEEIEEIKNFKQ